jgi:phospholipase/carboxylesterase
MDDRDLNGQIRRIQPLLGALLDMIGLFDRVQRKFHPAMIHRHGEILHARAQDFERIREAFLTESSCSFHESAGYELILRASDLAGEAARIFGTSDDIRAGVFAAMRAARKICRAREILFDLRDQMTEVDDFFRESPRSHPQETNRSPDEGGRIIHTGLEDDPYARGGSSLFVPGSIRASRPLPLVVALHGGSGHGRDFIWTWIREALTRGFFILSPTSLGTTWFIENLEHDLMPILGQVEKIAQQYAVDRSRILLTGLSDGGTFTLGCTMLPSTPFSAFAPVSGVLPPGDIFRAAGRRIRWIHGAHDWMFPADRAREGCSALKNAGADVVCRIIEDLAHAYPCEENNGILAWFDPGLACPVR